ncbi:MAG: histidine phosphatase family protein [Burkholderiales bacterium]
MGILYLVRHGQASFGAEDYDQLSALGERQCVRLGEYFHARGRRFDAVLTGTLKRHAQSLAGITQGLPGTPQPLVWPGLDEYDGEAVIAAIHPEPLPRPDTPELFRYHFRQLREGLAQWMAGATSPAGMPSYAEFVAGVNGALDHVRREFEGDVLIVSSGGPISTAIGQVLGTPSASTIDLNMRIRNSAVSELMFTPQRHMLLTFNTLPHLDRAEDVGLITYA